MTTHQIFLIGSHDDEAATFIETETDDACVLTCKYREKTVSATADDFFEALCKVRLELEAEHLIPFCYGASLNVYPSGMARSMARGKAAYKMQAGKHGTKKDLVRIFSEGQDVIPATVAQQREYWKEWVSSERA
jgi:hypothetical protein